MIVGQADFPSSPSSARVARVVSLIGWHGLGSVGGCPSGENGVPTRNQYSICADTNPQFHIHYIYSYIYTIYTYIIQCFLGTELMMPTLMHVLLQVVPHTSQLDKKIRWHCGVTVPARRGANRIAERSWNRGKSSG